MIKMFAWVGVSLYNQYMEQFFTQNGEIILRLVTAVGLGMLIGAERLLVHKEAGMKTHALVAMGASVFILVSEIMSDKFSSLPGFNPIMVASQIVVGIGFLGAGSIMLHGFPLDVQLACSWLEVIEV
jgi:uncharacterized membrane protein YhiD involved in acid resistance